MPDEVTQVSPGQNEPSESPSEPSLGSSTIVSPVGNPFLKDGIAAAMAGDKVRAKRILRTATDFDPKNEVGWLWLAGVTEVPEQQIRCLEKVLALKPDHPRAIAGLKVAYLQAGSVDAKAGKKDSARKRFEALVKLDPQHERGWHWLASVANSPQQAAMALDRVININPENGVAKSRLNSARLAAAMAENKAGNKEASKQYLEAIIHVEPNHELAWLYWSELATSAREAIPALQHVLEINPKNAQAKEKLEYWKGTLSSPDVLIDEPCPFCEENAYDRKTHCGTCFAIADMDRMEEILANPKVKPELLQPAVERLIAKFEQTPRPLTALFVSLAYLNLKDLDKSIVMMRAARQQWPTANEFQDYLQKMIRLRTSGGHSKILQQQEAARPTCLIVDDNSSYRSSVASHLEMNGFKCVSVTSGYEAFDYLRKGALPQIIVLDSDMPGMDGFQVLKMLRDSIQLKKIPVLFLYEKRGLFGSMKNSMAGASLSMPKASKPDDILKAVKEHHRQKPYSNFNIVLDG